MSEEHTTIDGKEKLAGLPHRPGVYRMLDAEGGILYVGKARDLKKRVASYFQRRGDSPKTDALVRQIADVEVTVTNTEAEALLLESNLIKRHRPRFNIVLRDDKSYPYIHLSTDHAYPRLAFYRGSRRVPGRLFGPYASAGAVRETLNYLHKLFQLRQCTDSFFENRSRPCLQYQIKRCSAPCVAAIDQQGYARDVDDAVLFLTGKSQQVVDSLVKRMESAATAQDYERAAHYRDQIATLNKVRTQQAVAGFAGDVDVIAHAEEGGQHCIAAMFIRAGRNLGSRSYFPRVATTATAGEVVSAFLGQYYLQRDPAAEILVNAEAEDAPLLMEVFSERIGRKVRVRHRVRGERARWLELARTNAEQALGMRRAQHATLAAQLAALQETFGLAEPPRRLECFDVSHTGGEAAVAACVVFGPEGPIKADYRRFNIRNVEPGDDYAALHEALQRRYRRLSRGEAPLPDILFVDGGKGQVAQAAGVLAELDLEELPVVGVAKGPSRRPGFEQLHVAGADRPLSLAPDSAALHLIQQIRDEAHRFAIGGHRARRSRSRQISVLEQIPGLGPKRRRELLRQFGGLQGVSRAGIEDLARTRGISRELARQIYERFH